MNDSVQPRPDRQAPTRPRDSRPALQAMLSRTWPHLLLACGCAMALTLLVIAYMQSSLGLQALDVVRGQSQRADHLAALQLLLVDAETGVRGYLLTGDPVYLDPYERAAPALASALRQVQQDFHDAPEARVSLEALVALVNGKIDLMAQAVAERTMGATLGDEMAGKLVMDEARDKIHQLHADVVLDGAREIDHSIERFRLAQMVGIVMAIASLSLLVGLFAVIQRQFALRERIASLLAGENARLDLEVQRRTAELSELARYLTHAREAEKARLARELHDELGALLTAAKLDAGWISRKLPAEVRTPLQDRLDRLQSTLTQGMALKRRIIDDLQPPLLKDLGLVEALRAMAEDMAGSQEFQVAYDLPDEPVDLDSDRALALFRIAQEAFTNILKYAKPRQVRLSLTVEDHWVGVAVADDGCGFDPEHLSADRHGIAGMKHRIQTYAGRFSLTSKPGSGTVVRASLPIA